MKAGLNDQKCVAEPDCMVSGDTGTIKGNRIRNTIVRGTNVVNIDDLEYVSRRNFRWARHLRRQILRLRRRMRVQLKHPVVRGEVWQ